MAAGLSLKLENLEQFRALFDEECERAADPDDLERVYLSDGELSASEWTLESGLAIESAGPWGQGFPEPLFEGSFQVVDSRTVGGSHQKYRLKTSVGTVIAGIHFGGAEQALRGAVRALYYLSVNRFRDAETLEIRIEQLSAEC